MGIVAPDPNLETEAEAAEAVGSIIKNKKIRGYIYATAVLANVGMVAANGLAAYLVANHQLAGYPVWLGAVGAVLPVVSATVHALSKANT